MNYQEKIKLLKEQLKKHPSTRIYKSDFVTVCDRELGMYKVLKDLKGENVSKIISTEQFRSMVANYMFPAVVQDISKPIQIDGQTGKLIKYIESEEEMQGNAESIYKKADFIAVYENEQYTILKLDHKHGVNYLPGNVISKEKFKELISNYQFPLVTTLKEKITVSDDEAKKDYYNSVLNIILDPEDEIKEKMLTKLMNKDKEIDK